RDREAVASAIKRLWQHGGFSTKSVVVGLGSQRAMVRQVDMPPIPDSELRSALRLKIGEFLPIPVEQAVVDFAPLSGQSGPGSSRRVLLVAAQRDVVVDELAAVEAAGLRVEAVDSSSLALLRAVSTAASPKDGGGPSGALEAVVGIGAELVTVAVREDGVPRFVRTVTLPGASAARGTGEPLASPSQRGRSSVAVSPAQRVDSIVSEVRSSLEYLLSQSGAGQFKQVLVTGGGALLPGLTEALSGAVGLPVGLAQAALELDTKELALDSEALTEASCRWLTAVGLAQWGTDRYGKPSLMPAEVFARRQVRRVMVAAAVVVLLFAGCLGAAWYNRVRSADSISTQTRADQASAVVFQAKINSLGFVLRVPEELQARRALAVNALNGDIDWIGLTDRLEKAMPADVTPLTVTVTKDDAGSVSPAPTPGEIVGSLSMTAQTRGGAKAVAQFIDEISRVGGLAAVWVSSTTNSLGVTSIMASADLTTGALSDRAAALPGGSK
ncbi:MAG TPA: pilus assembly protein PilM, partial [Acidimicrobiales bacterium]|nr:pilus assembly protein PilM [Acidimicrobiales bacterium]